MKFNVVYHFLIMMFLTTISTQLISQNNSAHLKPIAPDCNKAINIPFENKGLYGPTIAPNGGGETEEIQSNKKNDKYYFEKEHNTGWYYFDIKYDGILFMTITPKNSKDDYDFILFKYTDSTFCDELIKKNIIPVRTNISRTGMGGSEITGLSNNEENLFYSAGKGKAFSKSVNVKKGERYYLVLDNVYPNGGGHTIELGYGRTADISGIVLDENNKPKKAEVVLEDQKGNEIKKTMSDPVSGRYTFKNVWLVAKTNYNVVYQEDSSFIKISVLTVSTLEKSNYKLEDIKVVLPKLRKGTKYQMDAINFFGDSPTPLPTAYSSMKSLLKLMKKNPKMVIEIQGHINKPGSQDATQKETELSEDRAKRIFVYLLENGIERERMTYAGFGNKFMLFPNAKTEEEQMKNRRVEIKVVDY